MIDIAPAPPRTFADLDLRPELLQALEELGYEAPTPIQREAIGPLLAGRDVVGQAETGTGKTAAFALPMLNRLDPARLDGRPAGLVLVPTRELAIQVAEACRGYGRVLGARVLAVYGGAPIVPQLRELRRGVDIVVATPGRALDHLRRGTLDPAALEVVVLDEADEMLDMGFAEDIEAILDAVPDERQTVLFSATMPARIAHMVRRHLTDPVRIAPERERPAAGVPARVQQRAYMVAPAHRPAALARVLAVEEPGAAIIFCRTRAEVDQLTATLTARGHRVEALHGGLTQEQRGRVVERMRAGTLELVVATDVAARGLDIDQLTHVINADVPAAPETYVHRIGRVGRAGREGVAITLALPRDRRRLRDIERLTGSPVEIAPIPTAAELRARRLERTRQALRERLTGDDDPAADALTEALLEELAGEFDMRAIARAALTLAHERATASREGDDEDIPVPAPPADRAPRRRPAPGDRTGDRRGERGPRRPSGPTGPTGRVFVGAGRAAGVRPQDLVGAITGESSLAGRDIGAIRIHDRFALVEVPEAAVGEVVRALRGTTIKGRRATVRPDGAPRRP